MKVYCKNCKWFDNDIYREYACEAISHKNIFFADKVIDHIGRKIYKYKNDDLIEEIIKYYAGEEFFEKIKGDFQRYTNSTEFLRNMNDYLLRRGMNEDLKIYKWMNFITNMMNNGGFKLKYSTSINKNFNCPLYEQKWYKIWIRPKFSELTKEELKALVFLNKCNI